MLPAPAINETDAANPVASTLARGKRGQEKAERPLRGQLPQTQGYVRKCQGEESRRECPEWHDAMNAELHNLLRHYRRYEEMSGIIGAIRNEPDTWFTFMRHPYVDSSNWAERLVREVVKRRILRQALRAATGARYSPPRFPACRYGICLAWTRKGGWKNTWPHKCPNAASLGRSDMAAVFHANIMGRPACESQLRIFVDESHARTENESGHALSMLYLCSFRCWLCIIP